MKTKIVVSVGLTIALLSAGIVFERTFMSSPQQEVTEMEPTRYFSSSYQSARQAFIEAAQHSGASIESFQNPHAGPRGEPLYTDVVLLGSADAKNILVLGSGTHGVEGFAGSGIQVGLLREGLASRLDRDASVIMIHAINPFGFAHLRRVNEDNVDLNRNFVDHSKPYPANPGYKELSDVLAPHSISVWSDLACLSRLGWYLARKRMDCLREAVTGGQYSHPEGLFYGGSFETWSNKTIRNIAHRYLSHGKNVVLVDLHTGLGEYGNAEIILNVRKTAEVFSRAVAIWGAARVTSTGAGDSVSAPIEGSLKLALPKMLPQAEVTAVSLEFGTSPVTTVLRALRVENWLHHQRGKDHPDAGRIKAELLRAFYPEGDEWKALVLNQGKGVVEQALMHINEK